MTEDLVRAIATEVKAHGARLVLATLSNGIQVHPDAAVQRAYAARFGNTDIAVTLSVFIEGPLPLSSSNCHRRH